MALTQRDKVRLWLLLFPALGFIVLGYIATIFAASLLDNPALLLTLDSRNRNLVLAVGAGIDAVPYALIGFFRLLASDPLFYLLGFWYGDLARRTVLERYEATSQYLRVVENVFHTARYPLILVMPNWIVCLLAGTAKMRPQVFFTLNIVGTIGRLGVMWTLAKAFEDPLEDVIDWIQRYQWWVVLASAGLVALQVARGGGAEMGALRELEHEVEREREPGTQGADETSAPAASGEPTTGEQDSSQRNDR